MFGGEAGSVLKDFWSNPAWQHSIVAGKLIPQVMPVLLSHVLYFFESNTRSATIVGAIAGAGMGTLLTNAIVQGNKWEVVACYIALTLVLIFAMDSLSDRLRRKLIKGDTEV